MSHPHGTYLGSVRTLDERFLRPHPRTVLWWAQRETCRTCAHYRQERSGESRSGMSIVVIAKSVNSGSVRPPGRLSTASAKKRSTSALEATRLMPTIRNHG